MSPTCILIVGFTSSVHPAADKHLPLSILLRTCQCLTLYGVPEVRRSRFVLLLTVPLPGQGLAWNQIPVCVGGYRPSQRL